MKNEDFWGENEKGERKREYCIKNGLKLIFLSVWGKN